MEFEIDGVDYGPLGPLAGTWEGNKGMDVAPEPDGEEHNPYYETILYEPCGTVDNAESQELAILRYHQVVRRISNDEVFHNETGYWLWDADQALVSRTLTIPRGVALVAGGSFEEVDGEVIIRVHAAKSDANWPIIEAPFMRDNASTQSFDHTIRVRADDMNYEELTVVDIYGKRFDHTDANSLTRVS